MKEGNCTKAQKTFFPLCAYVHYVLKEGEEERKTLSTFKKRNHFTKLFLLETAPSLQPGWYSARKGYCIEERDSESAKREGGGGRREKMQ